MNRHPIQLEALQNVTRRHFIQRCASGLGALWLATQGHASTASRIQRDPAHPLAPLPPHFPGKVKNIIYLHMTGAPSQLDLFQYKPELTKLDGQDCPQEYLEGKRFAFITGVPKLLGPAFPFHQEKKTGLWISDRMPHFEQHLDKVCFIHSMRAEQFNHAPAQLLAHTGNPRLGYASFGSWVTYGLGSQNQNLPGFITLLSGGSNPDGGKALWGSGFLPSVYQGVQCRSHGEPVLFLNNPPGIDRTLRGDLVQTVSKINQRTYEQLGDPETATHIAQYEMAFRMQANANEAFDISKEKQETHQLYGTQPGKEHFANNCLLARRLVERGTRFVLLFDWGWDSHGTSKGSAINHGFKNKCQQIDQPIAALLSDLDQRGLLHETLVIWGGEFGRTPMQENRAGTDTNFMGRDHHPYAFTMWMAGAGVKPGFSYGETDPIGFGVTKNPVEVRDYHATMLHLLGLDHEKLVYPFKGLDQKLTSVRPARVVHEILS